MYTLIDFANNIFLPTPTYSICYVFRKGKNPINKKYLRLQLVYRIVYNYLFRK